MSDQRHDRTSASGASWSAPLEIAAERRRAHPDRRSSTASSREATFRQPPPTVKGRRPRFFYATQAAIEPPTFVLFASGRGDVHFSYRRYLENRLRDAFGFDGTPLRLVFRERSRVELERQAQPKRHGHEGARVRSGKTAKAGARKAKGASPHGRDRTRDRVPLAVVGAGAWGTTLALHARAAGPGHAPRARRGAAPPRWPRRARTAATCRACRLPVEVVVTADPAASPTPTELVVIAVPSAAHARRRPGASGQHRRTPMPSCCSVAKGIEQGTLLRMTRGPRAR